LKHLAIDAVAWIKHSREYRCVILYDWTWSWTNFTNLDRIIIVLIRHPTITPFTEQHWHDGMEKDVKLHFNELNEFTLGDTYDQRCRTIRQMKSNMNIDLACLKEEYPEWKAPKIEFKVMMKGGKIFRDIDVFLEEGSESYCGTFSSGGDGEESVNEEADSEEYNPENDGEDEA
jgi:hypothetical protein